MFHSLAASTVSSKGSGIRILSRQRIHKPDSGAPNRITKFFKKISLAFSVVWQSKYLSRFFFFDFHLAVCGDGKIHYKAVIFLTITKSILLCGIWWSVYILKSTRILCVSFSRTYSILCIVHILSGSRVNFQCLRYSQWVIFPTESCLV